MSGRRVKDRWTKALRWAAAAALLWCNACVERKLTIRSEPAGAAVTLDGSPLGATPVSVDFDDYGGREVTLSKAGYYRLREIVRVKPPFYQWFGIDFFFEMIWPFNIVDEQIFTLQMKPLPEAGSERPVDVSDLEKRAEELQKRAETYGAENP